MITEPADHLVVVGGADRVRRWSAERAEQGMQGGGIGRCPVRKAEFAVAVPLDVLDVGVPRRGGWFLGGSGA
ncbi:hypothetical protein FrEUN1fDRAFT_7737 [Parafrankia sp. EUN1f]|nr:hypothetical protein FrEUN1fDRAFT_7737 [Parafrankia sp. EUN1f]